MRLGRAAAALACYERSISAGAGRRCADAGPTHYNAAGIHELRGRLDLTRRALALSRAGFEARLGPAHPHTR